MKANNLLLGLAIFFLAMWGLTMLLLKGTIAYALSESIPFPIGANDVLESHGDRFVMVMGIPKRDLAIVYKRYGIFSYWYPLSEYESHLIIKADAPLSPTANSQPQVFQGRLRPLRQVAFSSHIISRFEQAKSLKLPPEAYVISVGESPDTFRPLVAMFIPVTIVWLGVLIAVVVRLRALILRAD